MLSHVTLKNTFILISYYYSLYILHGYMKLQIEDELAIGKVILDINPLVFILNQSICNS